VELIALRWAHSILATYLALTAHADYVKSEFRLLHVYVLRCRRPFSETQRMTMAEAKHPSRIDVHHHFFAPEYLDVMGDMAKRPVVRDWTADRSIEEMDKNGIATAVLSLSPPGLHHVGKEDTRRLARVINEHATKLRSTHPARYGHFAS